jgi:hypothetical protein
MGWLGGLMRAKRLLNSYTYKTEMPFQHFIGVEAGQRIASGCTTAQNLKISLLKLTLFNKRQACVLQLLLHSPPLKINLVYEIQNTLYYFFASSLSFICTNKTH